MFWIIIVSNLLSEYGKCLKLICAGLHVGSVRVVFIGVPILVVTVLTVACSHAHLKEQTTDIQAF